MKMRTNHAINKGYGIPTTGLRKDVTVHPGVGKAHHKNVNFSVKLGRNKAPGTYQNKWLKRNQIGRSSRNFGSVSSPASLFKTS